MKSRLFAVAAALAVVLMLAGAALAAPSTLSTFTVTPASAPIGTPVTFEGSYDAVGTSTAFCFYFASADAAAWNANFTTLNSVAGVTFAKGAGSCPAVTGYGSFFFYTDDTSAAVFGDTFSSVVTVPAVATGVKIVAVRQYSGSDCSTVGASCNTLENFKSVNLTVTGAPTTVYAGSSAAACTGYSPCYTDLNAAYNAVAAGGVIRVIDTVGGSLAIGKNLTLLDYTGSGALTGASLTLNSGAVLLRDLTVTGDGANPVFVVSSGILTVKGSTLDGAGQAIFSQSGGATVAYANNVLNFGNPAVAVTGGTFNGRHNWWGSITPANVGDADAFNYRLGADVKAWGEGALGGAAITGGTGTGVIVSHGRGDTNAPFGKATLADGNTQCSDYYDYFVAPGGSGNWQVTLPVDAGGGCDAIYNNRQVAVFAITGAGAPNLACSPDTACWNPTSAVNVNPVVQLGRNVGLRWTASTVQLSGTPLVAANQRGNDPTAVTMREITTQSQPFNWTLLLAASVLVAAMSAAGLILRRRAVEV